MAVLLAIFSMAQLTTKSIERVNYVFPFRPNFKCLFLHHLRKILIKSKILYDKIFFVRFMAALTKCDDFFKLQIKTFFENISSFKVIHNFSF